VGPEAVLLVVYSDGTNAHLLGISVKASAGTSSDPDAMTYTDLATINGVSWADLASWGDADFHF